MLNCKSKHPSSGASLPQIPSMTADKSRNPAASHFTVSQSGVELLPLFTQDLKERHSTICDSFTMEQRSNTIQHL